MEASGVIERILYVEDDPDIRAVAELATSFICILDYWSGLQK